MTARLFATGAQMPIEPAAGGDYRSGVCNIGRAEIARRRRTGHVGVVATLVLLAILVAVHAPVPLRVVAFLPAAVAASGYLQAWLKFCAGFGWLGVFNFREVGTTQAVPSAEDRRRDRATAARIGLASAGVGAVVALFAVSLPTDRGPWSPDRVDLLTGLPPDVPAGMFQYATNDCYTNSATGSLVVDPTYGTAVLNRDAGGNRTPVAWRPGFTGRRVGSEVEVVDPGGTVVAVTGRTYLLPGAYYGSDLSWPGLPVPVAWWTCGFPRQQP